MADVAQNSDQGIKKVAELIQGVKVAMLTTVMSDGSLRSRPMATQEASFEGTLWFFTGASSPKSNEIEKEHQVNVSYADAGKQHYVSVTGRANVVRDKAKAAELWNPAYKAWFPKGLDDPDLALLKVDVDQAEYWDTPSSTMVHLIGLAKAALTGQRYEPGEHKKVTM